MAASTLHVVFLVYISSVICDPEYVTWRLCKEVDISQCTVQNVMVDPCPHGPESCSPAGNDMYGVSLDMTPHFTAQKLGISITADMENDASSTAIWNPGGACGRQFCPLEAEEWGIFNIDLTVHHRDCGKFPIKVKLWNENDVEQACCVSFNVKSLI